MVTLIMIKLVLQVQRNTNRHRKNMGAVIEHLRDIQAMTLQM